MGSESRNLIEYKNEIAGVLPTGKFKAYTYLSIDNASPWSGGNSQTEIIDSKIYGENKDNIECYPYGSRCGCLPVVGVRNGFKYIDSDIIGFDSHEMGCGES